MSGFLLDTNVISELRRPRPDPRVVAFVEAQAESDLFVSDVAFAEIRFGIEMLDDPERRATIVSWLDHTLRPLFDRRVLPVDEDVLLRWRLLLESGKRRGHTFGQFDLLIACIAAENGLIVVTRDPTHFLAASVPVLNPWDAIFADATGNTRAVAALDDPELLNSLVARSQL